MKNFILFLLILVVGAFVFATVGVFALTKSPVDNWEGTVQLEIINADILVKQGNLNYQLVTENIILEEGDSVKTDASGEANIIVGEGAIIRLSANTEIVINEATMDSLLEQQVSVDLLSGKIWFRIIKIFNDESEWEVETPNIVATVRGTAFAVEVDNEDLDILVAESEVNLRPRKKGADNLKENIAVAGQRIKVNQKMEVIRDKVNLEAIDNRELKLWLNKNLESDKKFRKKVQENVNNELLKYLKEEPGTMMYEAQLLAEKIKGRVLNNDNLEELKDNRRLAETLWLAEKGEDKELKILLDRPELKNILDRNKALLPEMLENKRDNIINLFDDIKIEDRVFDLDGFRNEIQKIDINLNRIPEKEFDNTFKFGMQADFTKDSEDWESFVRMMEFFEKNPEAIEKLDHLASRLDKFDPQGPKDLEIMFNSPEYIEYAEYVNSLGFDFLLPHEINFMEEPEIQPLDNSINLLDVQYQ